MKLSNVSMNDGKMCAQLLNLLKLGRWELAGPDIAAHTATVQWVQSLAGQMADALRPVAGVPAASEAAPPAEGFRIKGMGPINGQKKRKAK